jgi:hypothetical protein
MAVQERLGTDNIGLQIPLEGGDKGGEGDTREVDTGPVQQGHGVGTVTLGSKGLLNLLRINKRRLKGRGRRTESWRPAWATE